MKTPVHCPWLIFCGLLSMAALFLNAGRFSGLVLLAGLYAFSAFTAWRLTPGFRSRWGLRALVFAALLLILGTPDSDFSQWYVKPEYTSRLGVLLAAELVLRAYQSSKPATRSLGDQLLLSGLILLAASNTFDRSVISVIVPMWMFSSLGVVRRMNRIDMPDHDAAPAHPEAPDRPKSHAREPARVARIGLIAFALSLGLGGVLAVQTFDREVTTWAVNLLQGQLNPRRSQIGLGMTPRLQGVFNPQASASRILRLDGFSGERHLRAMAYWAYVDGAWLPRVGERTFRPISSAQLRGNTPDDGLQRDIRVVQLSSELDGILSLPVDGVSIEVGPRGGVPTERDGTFSLRVVRGESASEWLVRISGSGLVMPLLPAPVGDERRALLWWPDELDPAIRQLAREVAGDGEPAERLARIASYLRSNNVYSLSFEPEGEPLTDFILNKRAAHCQYFASAMVVMARAIDLPSRFVTGYYAHEADGEATVVRQRDAHAWAEVYLDGVGWTVVDATPAGGRPSAMFTEVGLLRRLWEWAMDQPARFRAMVAEWSTARLLGIVAAGFAVVWAGQSVRRWWLRRQAIKARRHLLAEDPRLAHAARQFELLLARWGSPCPPGRTWREHIGSDPDADVFIARYEHARFGGHDPSPALAALDHLSQRRAPPNAGPPRPVA